MGNPGWGSKEMWHYFNKSETFHSEPWFKIDKTSHGNSGPIHTSIHPNAPITDRMMDSFIDKGLPLDDDMFATGKRPVGCGHCTRSVWRGQRMTGGEYLRSSFDLQKKLRFGNMKIAFRHMVAQVILDENLRATGVETIAENTNERRTFRCRKEIILSLGSYGSPKVCM